MARSSRVSCFGRKPTTMRGVAYNASYSKSQHRSPLLGGGVHSRDKTLKSPPPRRSVVALKGPEFGEQGNAELATAMHGV